MVIPLGHSLNLEFRLLRFLFSPSLPLNISFQRQFHISVATLDDNNNSPIKSNDRLVTLDGQFSSHPSTIEGTVVLNSNNNNPFLPYPFRYVSNCWVLPYLFPPPITFETIVHFDLLNYAMSLLFHVAHSLLLNSFNVEYNWECGWKFDEKISKVIA